MAKRIRTSRGCFPSNRPQSSVSFPWSLLLSFGLFSALFIAPGLTSPAPSSPSSGSVITSLQMLRVFFHILGKRFLHELRSQPHSPVGFQSPHSSSQDSRLLQLSIRVPDLEQFPQRPDPALSDFGRRRCRTCAVMNASIKALWAPCTGMPRSLAIS